MSLEFVSTEGINLSIELLFSGMEKHQKDTLYDPFLEGYLCMSSTKIKE